MNRLIIKNIWRLFLIGMIQVIVLKRINPGGEQFNYISLYLYPLFLMLLPKKVAHPFLIGIGFLTGLLIDICYNSPGVHAGACVFSTFLRPFILNITEPPSGYKDEVGLTKKNYSISWFMSYSALYLFLHLFFYFSIEAFTFVHIKQILLRTVSSFIFSWILILIYVFTLDPAE